MIFGPREFSIVMGVLCLLGTGILVWTFAIAIKEGARNTTGNTTDNNDYRNKGEKNHNTHG